MKKNPMPQSRTIFWPFNGGLDLVTPPLELQPSYLRSCSNVEIGINGGYSTLAGFERYSGKSKPSDAGYAILTCTITGTIALGDVLTDNTAAAYGTVIALPTGQAVLTLITGIFAAGNIKVGATVVGTCTGAQENSSAATSALNATYTNLAADIYRALISVVPGSGSVLGVQIYNGHVYAWRNNAGGTAAVMHVDSVSGWTAITMYNEISFTAGSGAATIIDGGTLTQGGVTATIKRVVVQSGALSLGTATGRLIITNPSGGNFAAGAATVGAGTLTLSGVQTAITFAPSGRFEFVNANFGGATGTKRMYGCDGVNRGFEFDGTTLVPISTGMTTDKPKFIATHKNHLFFSFASSAQHSSTGNPYVWSPILGATELTCGDDITGFVEAPGTITSGAMVIKTRNSTFVLYGNDSADWNLTNYSMEAGALPYTNQFITQSICLDDTGITLLSTVQDYGNFRNSVASQRISPYLNDLTNTACASCIVRQKNQYRLFFSGGGGVYVTFKDRKIQGMTTIDLGKRITCITSLEGASGREEIYFGSTDGYVYQMDIGTSFDGSVITWRSELAFNHCGSPEWIKQFMKSAVEITGSFYAQYYFSCTLGYASTEYQSATTTTVTSELSGSNWDTGTWDVGFWDGRTLAPSRIEITGSAENISMVFAGSSDEFQPFTMNGITLRYFLRRELR